MNHTAETTTDQSGLPPEDGGGWTERSPLKDSGETSILILHFHRLYKPSKA